MSKPVVVDCPEHLSLEYVKDKHINDVLASVGGNKMAASKILRIDRRTLYRWFKDQATAKKELAVEHPQ